MLMKMWASQETTVRDLVDKILRTDEISISSPNENERLLLAICVNSYTNTNEIANHILAKPSLELSSFEITTLAKEAKTYLDNTEVA